MTAAAIARWRWRVLREGLGLAFESMRKRDAAQAIMRARDAWRMIAPRLHAVQVAGDGRPQILVIDRTVPDPSRDSGSMRLVEIMRIMSAQGYGITLFPDTVPAIRGRREIDGVDVNVESLSRLPQWLSTHRARLRLAWLSRFQTVHKHACLIRHLAPDARLVFDTVDLHFLREGRRLEAMQHPLADAMASRIRGMELAAARMADVTVLVSVKEKQTLQSLHAEGRYAVVSNIHRPMRGEPGSAEGRSGVVFVGGTQHLPNREALAWLSAGIMPAIRARCPGTTVHVVGDVLLGEQADFSADGLQFHGRVPDLAPIYDACIAAIAPLRSGAGVKGKINSAMSHGLPVIATTLAIEGMGLVHGEDVLVADSAEGFSDAIWRLHHDHGLWHDLASAGLLNVRMAYSPEVAREEILALLDR
ncbi:hypothetical protein DCD74_08380 [Lysobacter oculi]|uniref:Sugar transferase n=1 Tax=Solilutibacter oculi TaxID=2698682 RepID=A0A344J6P0_9GAMM|nr:glycosyltransferase [Lysobacter oculi]AXA84700.1 hypothetical protein DCD74_08380 [Lysobacter oculi]